MAETAVYDRINDYGAVKIALASPNDIRSWSFGEVKKPETINYRTYRPERDGLFCERIFGPERDWECACGKYKGTKYKGVICDRCGVKVTHSRVRRKRMGHISLAAPIVHIWFFKAMPSRLGNLLDMKTSDLEKVVYYQDYCVTDPGTTPLKKKQLLTEEEHRDAREKYGDSFKAEMGADAVRSLLNAMNMADVSKQIREGIETTNSKQKIKDFTKRLKIVEAIRQSQNKPEWMIFEVIPVIPPDLRPLVLLESGNFATSDLNDLYRRIINRNNRLRKLVDLNAPEVIIRNEKRMLQQAVDALFDNGRCRRPVLGASNRPLKSLTDMIKGKQGRFRENLLGKRVDYSARSVIVVGPELKLHQCGMPKKIALELFQPFIIRKLKEHGYADTIKSAKKMIERRDREIWDILEEVIKGHPVLLNRAPTLHRIGIQAFEPVLIEGNAIKIHPLVCKGFNADFDGDQMAVHVPLSIEAQVEARTLMMSVNNLMSPANGRPIVTPTQDMVLGVYYLTKERSSAIGAGKYFSDPEDVRSAFDAGIVEMHAKVKLPRTSSLFQSHPLPPASDGEGNYVETTCGRVIFSEILPESIPFSMINKELTKKELQKTIDYIYKRIGRRETVVFLDNLEKLGFAQATRSGMSICISDMHIPSTKAVLIHEAEQEVLEIQRQYADGLITQGERYNKVIDIWANVTERVAEEMMKELGTEENGKKAAIEDLQESRAFNSVFMMADSGARGSTAQIRQLAGMRGLMAKPSGEIIETPITANFREGLTPLQYFISTHGARKGLADTALKTANSGYLTRRLVDVAQDVIIHLDDCETKDGIMMTALIEGGEIIQGLDERLLGRYTAEEVKDPLTKEVILKRNEELNEEAVQKIIDAGVDRMKIRSVLTCQSKYGVCAKCYGRDLARSDHVEIGEAIGIVAAQSIGEPGTQLTMRTFHIGGAASKVVEQTALEAKNSGTIKFINLNTVKNREGMLTVMNRNGIIAVADSRGREKEKYTIVYGAKLLVEDGKKVEAGQRLVEWDPYSTPIISEVGGKAAFGDILEGVTVKEELDEVTGLSRKVIIEYPGNLRPRISMKDEHGKTLKIKESNTLARYLLPAGAHILVDKTDTVFPGDILAKIPRETTKTKDITGGLPRVAELFEARKPKEQAIVSEIDGIVEFKGAHKGMRQVVVRGGTESREYLIPRGKHVSVHEGDWVRAGEALMDGSVNPHNILDILGPKELQRYLVDEVQKVYRLQGVSINDKHIEVIVRQMMRKIKVEDPGDTEFLTGDQVDRIPFIEANEQAKAKGGKPAQGRPMLLGITKASLTTESFVSAASFQETTRILTEAAIRGQVDELRGLKENVIMGRMIPAGTGMLRYRNTFVKRDLPPSLMEEAAAAESEELSTEA